MSTANRRGFLGMIVGVVVARVMPVPKVVTKTNFADNMYEIWEYRDASHFYPEVDPARWKIVFESAYPPVLIETPMSGVLSRKQWDALRSNVTVAEPSGSCGSIVSPEPSVTPLRCSTGLRPSQNLIIQSGEREEQN